MAWNKLESEHANQVIPNLVYVKTAMYTCKIDISKSIAYNLDEFLKMSLTLKDTPRSLDETSTV